METIKERLDAAVNYLINNKIIDGRHSVKTICEKTGRYPTGVRLALKGDKASLTKGFIYSFCTAFEDKISPEWIWSGEGTMLTDELKKDRDFVDKERNRRFLRVVGMLGLTDEELSSIGITKTLKSKIVTNTQNLSMDKLTSFCKKFENVSADYILFGRGEPIRRETTMYAVTNEEDYMKAVAQKLPMLPEYSFELAAGPLVPTDSSEYVNRYWYLPDCKDCDIVAPVVGDSMSPILPNGSYVALRKCSFSSPNGIPFGQTFAIVVEDEDTGDCHGYIKVLRRHKDEEMSGKYWIAHSHNSNYDDFDISISRVRSLWVVKQHVVNDSL